ncbi:MAG: type II secretion system protein GspE, partial [Myxococcales bacterium]|nr:type II secretion system protein GspE [Myxococcales bacterium]
ITRLTEMGIEPFLVAPALVGVVAQRLVRKVCTGCARDYEPTEAERAALGIPRLPAGVRFRRADGCEACQRTGYRGRVAVRELLDVSDAIRALIGGGGGADAIRAQAVTEGFRPMRFAALKLLFAGITTFHEVLRVTRG